MQPPPAPPSHHDLAAYRRPQPAQAAADAIPLLVDNTYHLFHLVTPPNTVHHPPRLRSSWARLRSTDLVNWTRDELPVVNPGQDAADPDTSGAWTGCAVQGPDGRMNLFYTGYSLPRNGMQVVLRMVANDKHGTHFEPGRKQIEIADVDGSHSSKFEDIDFRDPYIFFNQDAGLYWMLVATRLRSGPYWTRGCIALLTSPDLEVWTPEPEPLYAPGDMFCPECPELFTLPNGKWYLVYSRFHAPNPGTVYRVADSPRGPFRTPRDGSFGRLDARRWYAAKSCSKAGSTDRRVYFGWIADRCAEDGKWLWGGDLGIPRELFADVNGLLRVQPAQEVLPDFYSAAQARVKLSSIAGTSTVFPGELAQLHHHTDAVMRLDVNSCDAVGFGLVFDADRELSGHRLRFIPTGDTWSVILLTDVVPLDDFWADQYNLHVDRPVDGPETARHDNVTPVKLDGQAGSVQGNVPQCLRRIGIFVDDGSVDLGISLSAVDRSQ
ncbi:family 32 glycoside hydrolase [Microdochium trichocladiopsis]|uniref:beta-fructofuranosidase n=1 Tax=Microdochium trichocladiopsis TaxID=1682393 RepID=A0A9P8YE34_9PEZI|nr:family 32 glycoside hydrolase [Microdochium trichocladiopsis]KAH7037187.1 family 32 glycoside hydrolase [Microdochium trichocladiopsis]